MSRRQAEEPAFSTDSFLDVVCNLVGILIILIIVAGLRVSRAPVVVSSNEPAPAAPEADTVTAMTTPRSGIELTEISAWLEAAPAAPEVPVNVPPPAAPPAELVAQAEELRARIAQLADRNGELEAQAAVAQRRRRAGEQALREMRARMEADSLQNFDSQNAADAAETIRELQAQVERLATESAALREQTDAPVVLKHSVTPISRQVSEKDELHFRLSGNRVSVVPLEELAEALKLRMQRSQDLFTRLNRYEGTAGPVDGYVMKYVIEKQQPSAIEELRSGGHFLRIQLTYYELEAGRDVVSESVEEALTQGSQFLQALARARPGTALTFWVYPDSFDAHRKLQDFAHEARFDVAARPLPYGVPIAGSPNGSRSAAQ